MIILLVFAITSKLSQIPTEHIESIDSSESKLQIRSISSVGIFLILEVIGKILNLYQVHFDEAIDRVQTGLKKIDAVRQRDEKKTLAVIEGGKCLVSWLLKSQDPVLKTTITPRTHSKMGHTQVTFRYYQAELITGALG